MTLSGLALNPASIAKPILDEIGQVLAPYYGFTAEELDFIASTKLRAGNYDIKYRMGRDAEADDD